MTNVNVDSQNNLSNDDLIAIGKAVLIIDRLCIHDADKWYIMKEYYKWHEYNLTIKRLYQDKPNNWTNLSNQLSIKKRTTIKNIISLIYHLYYDKTDSVTSTFYSILDNLFGREQWYNVYVSNL